MHVNRKIEFSYLRPRPRPLNLISLIVIFSPDSRLDDSC